MNIEDENMMCVQSILCKITIAYKNIKTREDRNKWKEAIKEVDSILKDNMDFGR